jgi:tetratricopeptide (TPR) repeat protein
MSRRFPIAVLSILGCALLLAAGTAAAQGTAPPPAARPGEPPSPEAEKQREATRTRLEAAVAAQPGVAGNWIELSAFRAAYRDLPGAIAAIENGLQAVPGSVELMVVHGRLLLAARRVDDAIAAYGRAIAADPKASAALVERGDIYRNLLHKPQPALQDYDAALAINPRLVQAVVGRSEALIMLGKADEAVAELGRASASDPKNAPLRLMLADAYVRLGKRTEALAEVEAALAAQPNYVDGHIARGNLRREAGQLPAAQQDFEAALALDQAAVGALVGRALTYQAEGGNEAAARFSYAQALRIDPDNIFALNGLAWLLAEAKINLINARELAERAVKLAPNEADVVDTLGWVLRQSGDAEGSVQVLARAASLRPTAEILTHLGIAQLDLGATEAARSAFLAALKLTPNYPPANAALARLQ